MRKVHSNYPLRGIIYDSYMSSQKFHSDEYQKAIMTACHRCAVSYDEEETLECADNAVASDETMPGIDFERVNREGISDMWVEFISSRANSPLTGDFNGTHVLYGSAVSKREFQKISAFEFKVFFAVVDADYSKATFSVSRVDSLFISPVTIWAVQERAKTIYINNHSNQNLTETDFEVALERDQLINHMSILAIKSRFKNTEVCALQKLPDWLLTNS